MSNYTPEALGLPYRIERPSMGFSAIRSSEGHMIFALSFPSKEYGDKKYTTYEEIESIARFLPIAANSFHEMREALRMVTKSTEWSCMERSTQEAIEVALSKADQLEKGE